MLKKQGTWLLPGVGLLICIAFYMVTMLPQDRIYSSYKKAFQELQHPAGTKFISNYNAFGALEKTRIMYKEDFPQGCDYRVGEIREYSGAKESIRAFYAAHPIYLDGEIKSPGILFIPMDANGAVDPYGTSMEEASGWGPNGFALLENLKGDQEFLRIRLPASYYYVGIGGFSQTENDIRCQF